jgi:hypothetical protein
MRGFAVVEVNLRAIGRAAQVKGGKLPPIKETPWYPLSVMKTGSQGKVLVSLLENEWGRKLYSNLLIRNIAQSLYKVGLRMPIMWGCRWCAANRAGRRGCWAGEFWQILPA